MINSDKKKIKTIHSSRTMMFAELEKVMDYSGDNGNFLEALSQNVTGKKSSSGIEKTATYLKSLYKFDLHYPPFVVLKYFWKTAEPNEKPLIAFVYAITQDDLLSESIEVLKRVKTGEKVSIELFESMIEKYHPNQYSENTRKSMAQNIASSWKQAGFITGKVRNIRTQPFASYKVVAFAMLLSFLDGERGDFIMHSKSVESLCLNESKLREMAVEASKRDYLQYQYAGNVTSISFEKLIKKIESNAI
jgi:hypothetical protein